MGEKSKPSFLKHARFEKMDWRQENANNELFLFLGSGESPWENIDKRNFIIEELKMGKQCRNTIVTCRIHTQSMNICPIWSTVPSGPVSSVNFISKSIKKNLRRKNVSNTIFKQVDTSVHSLQTQKRNYPHVGGCRRPSLQICEPVLPPSWCRAWALDHGMP